MRRDKNLIRQADKYRNLPLHVAASHNNLKVVEWLLENGVDINAESYTDTTALHLAREPEIVASLLKRKPKLESRRYDGTPLQLAAKEYADESEEPAKQKWLKIIDLLRAAGANYDLIAAIYLDDLQHVRRTLAVAPEDAHKHRPQLLLRIAARHGRLDICKEFLNIPNIDVSDLAHGNGAPIIVDALPHPAIVRLFIEHGADIESRISLHNVQGPEIIHKSAPLLHYAACGGIPDTVKLLLDQRADPFAEIFDTYGHSKEPQTALDVAAVLGQVDNLLAIVRHPKFRDAEKAKRQTLIDRCLVNGSIAFQDDPVDHVSLYKGLLEAGANPNAIYNNRTAIQEAAGNLDADDPEDERSVRKNKSIRNGIKILREAGAKVDLFSAAALGDEATVREILRHSPKEASMIGPDGVPAIHMAVKMNYPRIVSLLLEAGCDVNLRNQSETTGGRGTTPIDWADFWGCDEIMELLKKAKGVSSTELRDKSNQPQCAEQEQPPKN